jgi:hypothetical protein
MKDARPRITMAVGYTLTIVILAMMGSVGSSETIDYIPALAIAFVASIIVYPLVNAMYESIGQYEVRYGKLAWVISTLLGLIIFVIVSSIGVDIIEKCLIIVLFYFFYELLFFKIMYRTCKNIIL